MNAFMLWLGILSLAPKPVTYEIEHFYTYDSQQKRTALPLQKKVFIPNQSVLAEVYVEKLSLKYKIEKTSIPHEEGWVVILKNNKETVDLMNQLARDRVEYKPVVLWEGVECLPANKLFITTKPFVTEKLLRERLRSSSELKILQLKKTGMNSWNLEVIDPVSPPNILVMANLLAEDTAWFSGAVVAFTPLYAPISGHMAITTPAILNLGYERQLEIVINVHNPAVKIRKDLLPKFGANWFVPTPGAGLGPFDEPWYDFKETVVTEEKFPEKTVIRMVTPFRTLRHGDLVIPHMEVAYEYGKKEDFIKIMGVSFYNSSVTASTGIEDIQPVAYLNPLPVPVVAAGFVPRVLPFTFIAMIVFWAGLALLAFSVLRHIVFSIYGVITVGEEETSEQLIWEELLDASAGGLFDDWRTVYKNTVDKLSKVMFHFYGINTPLKPEMVDSPDLKNVVSELENLYKKDPTPQPELLTKYVSLFVKRELNSNV